MRRDTRTRPRACLTCRWSGMPGARAGARAAPELQVESLVERDGELQVGDQGRPCAVPHAAGR